MNEEEGGVNVFEEIETEEVSTENEQVSSEESEGVVSKEEPQRGGYDPDELQQGIGKAVGQAIQQYMPKQQEPQMSEAEIAKALNRWDPDDDFVNKFHGALVAEEFDPQKLKVVIAEMRSKMMQEAQTYAQLYSQYQTQQLQQQYAPVMSNYQRQQQEKEQQKFFKKYPSLKTYESMLPAVAQRVSNSGVQFRDFDHQAEVLAKAAEAEIKKFNNQFSLQVTQQRGKSTTPMFGGQQNAGNAPKRVNGTAANIW